MTIIVNSQVDLQSLDQQVKERNQKEEEDKLRHEAYGLFFLFAFLKHLSLFLSPLHSIDDDSQ